MFPMWSSIAPKVKINVKRRSNESAQLIDGKTNSLSGDCESEVIVALIRDMKMLCKTTQARL
jgi:hypothetical protein